MVSKRGRGIFPARRALSVSEVTKLIPRGGGARKKLATRKRTGKRVNVGKRGEGRGEERGREGGRGREAPVPGIIDKQMMEEKVGLGREGRREGAREGTFAGRGDDEALRRVKEGYCYVRKGGVVVVTEARKGGREGGKEGERGRRG